MPSRKRTVKYSEDVEPDGDKNVEVSEEQSVDNTDTDTEQSNQQNESEDERYTASAG